MAKEKSSDYKQGWGDCKAAIQRSLDEAFRNLHGAAGGSPGNKPSEETKRELALRVEELRRVRAILRALKA